MTHVTRGRQRSGKGAEPIDTSVALGKRRGRMKGRFDLVAFDVDPYGASPVVGDLGECFDDLIGTKWTSLVPSVRVGVKVLEPGRENAWRVPGVFKLQEDPVKAGLQGGQCALVAFVGGEMRPMEGPEERGTVDHEEVVGAYAAPS